MTEDDMINCREPERQVERAVAIMHRLRQPGGCPWDAEQTHESILTNLVEECYECIDALRERDWAHVREELGDVLLQVIFHAELTRENPEAAFGLNEIARELSDKLVRRHPHVFGNADAKDTDAVLTQWDRIKRREHANEDKPYLQDCGKGLPALMKAYKLTKKVAKVGFDWPTDDGVVDKIREETAEVQEALALPEGHPHVEEELGDLLFVVVNLCRRRGVNPEMALAAANAKFERRFNRLEQIVKGQGMSLDAATAEQMEEAWQQCKREEKP